MYLINRFSWSKRTIKEPMSSTVFQELALEKVEALISAYETSKRVFWNTKKKKLIHAGEYGEFREKAVIDLLRLFIPQHLSITEGFIITALGDVSTQCDIIVYDPKSCPRLVDSSYQKFIPVESVVAVGEVKSTISTPKEMREILNKLAYTKSLKDKVATDVYHEPKNIGKYKRGHLLGSIFTFVLAKSVPTMPTEGFQYSKKVKQCHKHNVILSIDNGAGCYNNDNDDDFVYHYPYTNKEGVPHLCPQHWFNAKTDEIIPIHFKILLTALSFHCSNSFLFEFDSVLYMTDNLME